MYPQDFFFIFHGFLCFLVYGSSISHTRRGLGAGVTQVVDFDCPEEFGYYPHPSDCTQYYVCVFGGALLESCTGGLMYSHELQTCDWPRNVGCGESGGSDGGTISTVRVTDPRTRNPQQSSRTSSSPQQNAAQVQPTRSSHRQEYSRPHQEEVIQQQIYAEEDLGPAEEVESDRQQRVYRGQPSTIGQVQRDRDGLRPLKNSVHSQNVIPTGPGTQDKISVVSFGSQRPSAPRPQEQYRRLSTSTAHDFFSTVLNDGTDNLTKTHSRAKRQVFARTGQIQANSAQIPVILFSGVDNQFTATSFQNPYRAISILPGSSLTQAYNYKTQSNNKVHLMHPAYEYYHPQNVAAAVHQANIKKTSQKEVLTNRSHTNDELIRLTKSTIQSEFRPIRYSKPAGDQTIKPQNMNIQRTKYLESIINPLGAPVRIVTRLTEPTVKITTKRPRPPSSAGHKLFSPGGLIRVTTEKARKNSTLQYHSADEYKNWYGATKTVNTKYNVHITPFVRTTTERHLDVRTTPKPSLYRYVEKPKDYDVRWYDFDSTTKETRNATSDVGIVKHHRYVQFIRPKEYDYDEEYEETEKRTKPIKHDKEENTQLKEEIGNRKKADEIPAQNEKPLRGINLEEMRKKNMSFFDFMDVLGFRDAEEVKAAIKTKISGSETTTLNMNDEKFYVPENKVHIKRRLKRPVRYQTTTERPRYSANQIEAPRVKIPEEYYENFKPFPTKSLYLTRQPDENDDDDSDENTGHSSMNKPRVEQVQTHQLTSALPPLTATPRSIERYNTSQRFQPSQFDQYYTVYDDGVEIYRSNDYSEQFQSPSSTPSSNIANQYRGQTTYKQSLEENAPEPVQHQQHRNTYSQDLYSPPPVLQDYNDQYNVQIDDQQYQQLGQPTPKSSSRSESRNSSKDALTESSGISVTLIPENVTSKPETAPIIRRSDSNSYFSISSFGPSTVLLPPLRFTGSTPKFLDTTFPPPKSEKPFYSDSLPVFQNGRANFEPPKNGGALAKTFNSFDNLLSSFLAAVTKPDNRPAPTPSSSTTPPTPVPPKTSPETIVRSEIGRIHHDPVVITENFKIRQPTLRKPEVSDNSKLQIVSLPSPSSTPVPPKLSQNDYLAYFVEIEPKKPKKEEARGFLLTTPKKVTETTTEPKIITKDNVGLGQSDHVGFNVGKNRPFNNFIRIVPTSQSQNIQLGTTLELEPIAKPQEKKKVSEVLENDTIEKQKIIGPITTISRQPFQPLGKWVIAKNERPQQPVNRFQGTPKPNPFEVFSQEGSREEPNFRGKVETEITQKEKPKEIDAGPNRGRGSLLQIHANPIPELETTVVSSPYKFLLVDLDSTTEQLSTPAPFSRNPENEERNRFSYKTNPESRVRPRYFDNSSNLVNEDKIQNPFSHEPVQVSTETTTLYLDTDDRIKFYYKTNPESRFRNRFIEDKKPEDVETTPKIIVPDIKPEVKPILVLEEKPIQVLSQEEKQPQLGFPKRRKPEFRPKNVEIEPSKPSLPARYRLTTEPPEAKAINEEFRKPPRRVVKIHRNDLKNQRLSSTPKLKRIQKPSTKSPIVVLEDLEDKTLSKENEIHPISTYRPIVVADGLDAGKNKTRFRFTVEDERDFTVVPDNKIGLFGTTEKLIIDTVPRGFEKPSVRFSTDSENDVPDREPSSEKPLYPALKWPQSLKNFTQFENRATTKAYRGKFKPSDSSKLRLRPTTASPDSESTPGPHLTTRQPGGYTIGSTGNEVTINRGTPSPNRGTRPTLKPSTAIVSKASEFIDIYRYPPRRPPNLYATPTPDKSAAKCRKDVCLLPDCSCGGKDIPGGYSPEEIPQLVLLTFDDSVNDLNKGLYAELFERGRVNPNGCPISATFYVSHEWTDYSQVQNLYANGHEIASHSITHSFGEQFSQKKWTKEIAGQREILAAYGGVKLEDIRGMRAPFLAVGGNKMFKMLYDSNFTYDSSMPIYENRPPSWPYTLDYKLFHDCMIPPCPTKSYPGVWEVPMVMWQDLNGGRCSMGDACSNPPTADGVYKMLIKNFERHFTTNRAPFGLYYHAAWFTHEHHKEGFIAFLDTIVNMPEVWLVTTWQAIEWVRDPQPLSTVNNFPPFQCNVEKAKKCNNPKVCNLWHKSGVRYMRTCQPCPDVYPWTGKTGVKNSRVDNEIIDE